MPGLTIIDTAFVASLWPSPAGLMVRQPYTGGAEVFDGFYAVLCTAGTTVFCSDASDDYDTNFFDGDIIVVKRDSDTTYWCATAGVEGTAALDGYSYSANNYDSDCAACISGGYGG